MSSRISARILVILALAQCSLFFGLIAQSKITAAFFRRTADSLAMVQDHGAWLFDVSCQSLDTTGKSDNWRYDYIGDSGRVYTCQASLDTVTFQEDMDPGSIKGGYHPLTDQWIDSDSAFAVAERAGGTKIRREFPSCTIVAYLFNYSNYTAFSCWRIVYHCSDSTRTIVVGAADGIAVSVKDNASLAIPNQLELHQNYPNPFNPSTTIHYALPQRSHVTVTVFNLLGQQVATLVNEIRNAGVYEAKFDGSNLTSGVYFYRLQARQIDGGQAGDFVQAKKLLILK